MKKLALYFLVSSSISLLSIQNFNLSAQVSIGSSIPPLSGMLLDLKEYDDAIAKGGGRTATRGLILPRVALSSSMGDLGKTLDKTLTTTGVLDPAKHVGLLVYNIQENKCLNPVLYKGIHYWDGTQWILLNGDDEVLPIGVFKETDPRDGEVYLARDFGNEAGVWMLENLRYNPKLNPDVAAGFNGSDFIHSSTGLVTDKVFYYPIGTAYTPSDTEAPADWISYKKNGLLYSWVAATNGQNPSASDQATSLLKGPQGICPSGWHLPSDKEWSILERHIYNNAQNYSTYQQSQVSVWTLWLTAWETSSGNRPPTTNAAHGAAMISQCMLNNKPTGGKSNHALDGGFDVRLVGNSFQGSLSQYGSAGFFWTASSRGTALGWNRSFIQNQASVNRDTNNRVCLFSVRCKKD